MTDKQIIIDGVDVSECECYSEHREGYCGWHTPCDGDREIDCVDCHEGGRALLANEILQKIRECEANQ